MSSVLLKVLLQILVLFTAVICLASARVCYSSVSSYTSNAYYVQQLYYYRGSYTYSTSCGFWGWRRCRRTGYNQQSAYRQNTLYRYQLRYSRTSRCCTGYAGTPPNCRPVCSVCHNGGTCISPQTCRCAAGWTGSTCNTVPSPTITTLPSGPIQGAMVGSPQNIQCTVSTISGVGLSSVIISWTGPGGESITNDSRVTISPTTSSGNNYTSSLQFTYLMEGDEGMYTCTVMIVNARNSISLWLAHLTVPAPLVIVHTPKNQIVGQSLMLKCDITTVRGITSNVNVIWSSDGIDIKRTEGINVNSRTSNSLLYKDSYDIVQLNTADENRTYDCMAVIAAPSPVKTTESVTLNVTIPYINITTLPSGPIQGAMVGNPQDIQCIVSTVSGVELSSVMISWMGPGGEPITNDSRVTISLTTSSDNNYTSSLQFTYLMEGDEGMYTCNVMILETTGSESTDLNNLTVPAPYNISVIPHNVQTVGQSLLLECIVTTVRGITSSVDIVWSSNDAVLNIERDVVNLTASYSANYISTYNIPQLSTFDDGRVYSCEVVINTNPPVTATGTVMIAVNVPLPILTILPSTQIQGTMVGNPQDIQCIVSTVSGVELSSVMISWMGPGGEPITNDSRVTISPTTSSGNNYTSSLQFTYLMEGDEGMYTCNVMILETNISDHFELNNFIIPIPNQVYVTAPITQMVGQSLLLRCSVTTVRGITSRVYTVWSSNGLDLERVEADVTSITNKSVEYTGYYSIEQLNETDDGRVYQCTVVIDASPPVMTDDNITSNTTVKIAIKSQALSGGNNDDNTNVYIIVLDTVLFVIVIIIVLVYLVKKRRNQKLKMTYKFTKEMEQSAAFNENSTKKDTKEFSETAMSDDSGPVNSSTEKDADALSETTIADDSVDPMYLMHEKTESCPQDQIAIIYRNPSASTPIKAGTSNTSCTIDANSENTDTTT